MRRLLTAAVGGFLLSEWCHAQASRQGLPNPAASDPVEAVLVLGFPSYGQGPNVMQRWRVDIAVRTAGQHGRIVFSGGGMGEEGSEAAVMARDAGARRGFPESRIATEPAATSTWENIAFSLPLLVDASTVAIASSPMHAARARRYLALQDPALAARLVPARDYVFGEQPLLKAATALHYLVQALNRLRR